MSRRASQRVVGLAAAILGMLVVVFLPSPAEAAEWYRYENDYFVAFSDASERKTRRILRELEMFRAAASQVANLNVGRGEPKTEVLIFRKKGHMDELSGNRQIGGFATSLADKFYIVVPASRSNEWDAQIIRHEFAHVLLRQLPIEFPLWYREGFAELVSTIRFVDRGDAFTLGEPPIDAKYVTGEEIGWNRLVDQGWSYESHTEKTVRGAYLQSWLLTHYAMLGDDFVHTPKLHKYLRDVADGARSLEAFERAFGMDPDTLWRRHLREYSRKPFALVFDFRFVGLHLTFDRTSARADTVAQLVEQVKRARAEK